MGKIIATEIVIESFYRMDAKPKNHIGAATLTVMLIRSLIRLSIPLISGPCNPSAERTVYSLATVSSLTFDRPRGQELTIINA